MSTKHCIGLARSAAGRAWIAACHGGAKTPGWIAANHAYDCAVLGNSLDDYNLGFPGQYYDAETGFWYNGFRDYDGRTGGYLQSDSIGLAGGFNTDGCGG
ncbi:RHS repeat-associated core domain-containing protein [Luteimonas sp. RC10]|uniref:RHS repeat-associated core domain-containing protein n=1 Tax=Luteimonas sp. RC10 TaxID=2587035 RepID=UPI0017D3B244|nr:RHS repeat-associated core domain-containing protein [Luteimonas sp. RC10]MBB3342313.1 RHS repeat-associated protein [Luteimonas sp. RC10]